MKAIEWAGIALVVWLVLRWFTNNGITASTSIQAQPGWGSGMLFAPGGGYYGSQNPFGYDAGMKPRGGPVFASYGPNGFQFGYGF